MSQRVLHERARRRRRARMVLSRQHEGRRLRQMEDVGLGPCIDQMREATRDFYAPIPLGATEHTFYRGEVHGPLTMLDDGPAPSIVGGAGFASLGDLIQEATVNGKAQPLWHSKAGVAGAVGFANSLAYVGSYPPAYSAPAAIAAGAVPTNATVGSQNQNDPASGDTLHMTTFQTQGSAAPNTLLLYDRLWHGAVAMSSTSSQSVTGVPTRYTGTAAKGNFMACEVRTALSATSHNNTLSYVDQDGNTAETAAAVAGIASAIAGRLDQPNWFIPLNSNDSGVRSISSYACSASVTGQIDIFIGRPLMFAPVPNANSMFVVDGINSAFNLTRMLNGCALSFLELKGVATATTYTGSLMAVSG